MSSMVDINLPYLASFRDRHGRMQFYVRVRGRREAIREPPGTLAFLEAYKGALGRLKGFEGQSAAEPKRSAPKTLEWLGRLYMASAEFKRLDRTSQRNRAAILESCFAEPRKPGDAVLIGGCPLSALSALHIRVLRDRKAELPGASNNRLKYLSSMFAWAIEAGHLDRNPAREVRRVAYASSGFHTWSPEEIAQFETRWPLGTKPRLAIVLLMFSGVRRSDVVRLGRQHRRDGWFCFVPQKTSYRRQRELRIPILAPLQAAIEAAPTGDLTYLVTEYGRPFTAAGFGGWFKKACERAGLSHCSAHGLRKAAATIAAENGATELQLMAIFDWDTIAQATTYTRAANRKKLAGQAMSLLEQKKPAENSG